MTVSYGDVGTYFNGAVSTRPKLTVTYTETPATMVFTVTVALEVKVTSSQSFAGLSYAFMYEDGTTIYQSIRPAAVRQDVTKLNQWVELTSYTRTVTRTVAKVHASNQVDYSGEIQVYYQNTSNYVPAEQGSGTYSIRTMIPAKTSYNVTFNDNGGSGGPFYQTKWYDETLVLSSTQPTRSGYVFRHWNTNVSDTGTSYSPGENYTVNAVLGLNAIWNPIISYNANGGSGAPASQTKTFGENLTLSSTVPTRSGYSFVHWNTSAAGTGSSYAPGATYSANVAAILYAIWTPIVSYNANGGSGAPASQVKPLNEPLTLSATTPTRTGFKFASWNTASDGSGATYYPNGSYSSTSTATLYAIWDYALTIGTMTVERAAQSGDADVMGRYLKCSIPWSTDSANNGTRATFTSGSVSQTVTLTGTSGTATALLNVGALPTADYSASVTVTDSLGASKSASATTTAASTGYTHPAILNMTVTRSDSTGEPDDSGEYALLEFDWSVAAVGSQTKPQSITVTAYDGSAMIDSDTVTTFSAATGYYSHVFGYGSTFKAEKTYLFTAVLEDRASSATKSEVLSMAYFTFDVLAGGHGVAFGKPATTAELMDVGYEIHSDTEVSATDSNQVIHKLTEKANQSYVDGFVKGVKGDDELDYRSGYVNITPSDIGAVSIAGDEMTGNLSTPALHVTGGRVYGSGDDEGMIIGPAPNNYAGLILGTNSGRRSVYYLPPSGNPIWKYNDGSNNYILTHPGKTGTIEVTGHTHTSLPSLATITGSTQSAALKARFDSYKSTTPRNQLIDYYSSAMGNGALAMGYFLSGYDTNPYGGFFVCHYNTPRYVGIANGAYTDHLLISDRNYTTYCVPKRTVLYNNTTGTNGTVTLSASAANFNHMRIFVSVNDWPAVDSIDVYSPNGKKPTATISSRTNTTGPEVSYFACGFSISTTSITRSFESHFTRNYSSGSIAGNGSSTRVYVTRVEAWNE